MGTDSLAEKTPNARIYLSNLSAQAKIFWILMISLKNVLHWESVVRA